MGVSVRSRWGRATGRVVCCVLPLRLPGGDISSIDGHRRSGVVAPPQMPTDTRTALLPSSPHQSHSDPDTGACPICTVSMGYMGAWGMGNPTAITIPTGRPQPTADTSPGGRADPDTPARAEPAHRRPRPHGGRHPRNRQATAGETPDSRSPDPCHEPTKAGCGRDRCAGVGGEAASWWAASPVSSVPRETHPPPS